MPYSVKFNPAIYGDEPPLAVVDTLEECWAAEARFLEAESLPPDTLMFEDEHGNVWGTTVDKKGTSVFLKIAPSSMTVLTDRLSPTRGAAPDVKVCCRENAADTLRIMEEVEFQPKLAFEAGAWRFETVEVMTDGGWKSVGSFRAILSAVLSGEPLPEPSYPGLEAAIDMMDAAFAHVEELAERANKGRTDRAS